MPGVYAENTAENCHSYESINEASIVLPIGAAISCLAYAYLLWMYFVVKAPIFNRHPTAFAIYKCIAELMLVQQYLWQPFLNTNLFYESYRTIIDNDDTIKIYCNSSTLAAILSFFSEVFFLCDDFCFLVISIDLRVAYTNPFSSFLAKHRPILLAIFSYSVLQGGLLMLCGPQAYGLSNLGFPWIQDDRNSGITSFPSIWNNVDLTKILFYYVYAASTYLYALWANFQYELRNNKGLPESISKRKQILNRSKRFVVLYTLFACLSFLFEGLAFTSNSSASYSFASYMNSFKGLFSLIVITLSNYEDATWKNLNPFQKIDPSTEMHETIEQSLLLQPHLNFALRAEILYFTTQGLMFSTRDFHNLLPSLHSMHSGGKHLSDINRRTDPDVFSDHRETIAEMEMGKQNTIYTFETEEDTAAAATTDPANNASSPSPGAMDVESDYINPRASRNMSTRFSFFGGGTAPAYDLDAADTRGHISFFSRTRSAIVRASNPSVAHGDNDAREYESNPQQSLLRESLMKIASDQEREARGAARMLYDNLSLTRGISLNASSKSTTSITNAKETKEKPDPPNTASSSSPGAFVNGISHADVGWRPWVLEWFFPPNRRPALSSNDKQSPVSVLVGNHRERVDRSKSSDLNFSVELRASVSSKRDASSLSDPSDPLDFSKSLRESFTSGDQNSGATTMWNNVQNITYEMKDFLPEVSISGSRTNSAVGKESPMGSRWNRNQSLTAPTVPSKSQTPSNDTPISRKLTIASQLRSTFATFHQTTQAAREMFSFTPVKDFKFRDYCPRLFSKIRQQLGIEAANYAAAFESTCKATFSEGRSGAFFFYSSDERYIVKSTTKQEMLSLMKILTKYIKFLEDNPDSLLSRFLGAHCITMYNNEIFFVVIMNCFPKTRLSQRYDLKGSWVNRSSAKKKKQLDKSTDLSSHSPLFSDQDVAAKDVVVSDKAIRPLRETIKRDIEFLRDQNLMDYSLLVGVQREKFFVNPVSSSSPPIRTHGASRSSSISMDKSTSEAVDGTSSPPFSPDPCFESGGKEASAGNSAVSAMSPLHQTGPNRDNRESVVLSSLSQELSSTSPTALNRFVFEAGSSSLDSSNQSPVYVEAVGKYYFGIIDILTEYTLEKKIERLFKIWVLGREAGGISSIPSDEYCSRFWANVANRVLCGQSERNANLEERGGGSITLSVSEHTNMYQEGRSGQEIGAVNPIWYEASSRATSTATQDHILL